jgi:molybdenum cofactor biosynthesis enzyme MoaA
MKEDKLRDTAHELYFSIAVVKECNCKCGYCYPFGQNKSIGANMSDEEFFSIVTAAYESGFNKFKISGGEPTLVKWLFDEIEEVLNLHPEVNFTIITNGYDLEQHLDALEKHKDNISIQFSLDSASDQPKEGISKILNDKTRKLLLKLSEHGIKTRINTVLTKQNKVEVNEIIRLAAKLGFSIKLFNLFIQDKYIATNGVNGVIGKYSNLSPFEYWKENYVNPEEVLDIIKRDYEVEKVDAVNEEGFGSVQTTLRANGVKVILLNSSGGAFFNPDICIKKCPLFGKTCEKGLFNPLVSSNAMLHIDDCNNQTYRWNLRGKSHEEILLSMKEILKLFAEVKFVNNPISIYPKVDRHT